MAALKRSWTGRTLVIAALASPAAWAQAPPGTEVTTTSASNAHEAERLFRDAVQRLDQGDYASACPLLEQSQALDPSSGTLLNLGDCYEHTGRVASAWHAFADAEALARAGGRRDRAEVAEVRKNRLLPLLAHLKLIRPQHPAAGLSVELDGRPLDAAALDAPIAVDPGDHDVRARAPGLHDVVLRVRAGEPGATTVLQIPNLSAQDAAAAGPVPPPAARRDNALDGQELAAVSAGAVGIAGLVVGTVFGLKSQSKHAESDDYCTGHVCQDPRGVELMDEARTAGTVSTTAFVIGGLGLATGAILWFARPFGARANATVAVAPASITVRGAW